MELQNTEGALMNLIDRELVRHCLQGDEIAWEDFVRSHALRIYNLSYRFTKCSADAEDLTQDVFVQVYQTLNSFHAETGCLSGWLLRVARNLLIDRYRGARRSARYCLTEELEDTIEDARASNPLQQLERNEAAAVLHEALQTLPPDTRHVIVLRYLEGMALHEVATFLHVPLGTVKSRMIRGHRQLARILCRGTAEREHPPTSAKVQRSSRACRLIASKSSPERPTGFWGIESGLPARLMA